MKGLHCGAERANAVYKMAVKLRSMAKREFGTYLDSLVMRSQKGTGLGKRLIEARFDQNLTGRYC